MTYGKTQHVPIVKCNIIYIFIFHRVNNNNCVSFNNCAFIFAFLAVTIGLASLLKIVFGIAHVAFKYLSSSANGWKCLLASQSLSRRCLRARWPRFTRELKSVRCCPNSNVWKHVWRCILHGNWIQLTII